MLRQPAGALIEVPAVCRLGWGSVAAARGSVSWAPDAELATKMLL